ncbi:unnamed protein product [Closterium sp. NIES-53]
MVADSSDNNPKSNGGAEKKKERTAGLFFHIGEQGEQGDASAKVGAELHPLDYWVLDTGAAWTMTPRKEHVSSGDLFFLLGHLSFRLFLPAPIHHALNKLHIPAVKQHALGWFPQQPSLALSSQPQMHTPDCTRPQLTPILLGDVGDCHATEHPQHVHRRLHPKPPLQRHPRFITNLSEHPVPSHGSVPDSMGPHEMPTPDSMSSALAVSRMVRFARSATLLDCGE